MSELSDKDIIAVRKVKNGVELEIQYRIYDEDGRHVTEQTSIVLTAADIAKLIEKLK